MADELQDFIVSYPTEEIKVIPDQDESIDVAEILPNELTVTPITEEDIAVVVAPEQIVCTIRLPIV